MALKLKASTGAWQDRSDCQERVMRTAHDRARLQFQFAQRSEWRKAENKLLLPACCRYETIMQHVCMCVVRTACCNFKSHLGEQLADVFSFGLVARALVVNLVVGVDHKPADAIPAHEL